MKKTLQEEIYSTWKLWKTDKGNENFYDTHIICLIEEFRESPDWIDYWESLKYEENNSNS